jgi:predicted aspartyl protease
VYQCREADAEIADLHQVLGLSGGALVCQTTVEVAGETLVACIDTGATFSLLAKTTYDELHGKLPALEPPTVFLEGAGGDSLEVAGAVNIDLQLGNENYRQLVQVGRLAGLDLLLGMDWLSTYGITVDCASRTIKIGVQCVAFGQALKSTAEIWYV